MAKKKRRRTDMGDMMGLVRMGGMVPMAAATGLGLASQTTAAVRAGTPAAATAAIPGIMYTGAAGMVGMSVFDIAMSAAERAARKQRRKG